MFKALGLIPGLAKKNEEEDKERREETSEFSLFRVLSLACLLALSFSYSCCAI
jgi:hypothetical protein